MTKLVLAVFVALTAACQTEPSEKIYRLDTAEALAVAKCQRYVDCAFDGAEGSAHYYDQCVYWTKIAICGDGGCTADAAIMDSADDVDECLAALSEQVCHASVYGNPLDACKTWNLIPR